MLQRCVLRGRSLSMQSDMSLMELRAVRSLRYAAHYMDQMPILMYVKADKSSLQITLMICF